MTGCLRSVGGHRFRIQNRCAFLSKTKPASRRQRRALNIPLQHRHRFAKRNNLGYPRDLALTNEVRIAQRLKKENAKPPWLVLWRHG